MWSESTERPFIPVVAGASQRLITFVGRFDSIAGTFFFSSGFSMDCPICGYDLCSYKDASGHHRCPQSVLDRIDSANRKATLDPIEDEEHRTELERLEEGYKMLGEMGGEKYE